MHRIWQGAAGLITMLLITRFLTVDSQGLYYSFLTLTSPYLFDLGLSTVALQNAAFLRGVAHSHPGDRIQGHFAFQWLLRAMRRWYAWTGFISVLILYPLGYWLFNKSEINEPWQWQWAAIVLLSGLALNTIPQLAIMEGVGRVKEVYGVRLVQSVLAALCVWAALVADAGLWIVVIAPFVTLLVVGFWIGRQPLLKVEARHLTANTNLLWKDEIWPMQWRIGLTFLCGFLLTQIYTPILLHYHGPKVAGQFGLSLAIANTVGLIAQSWLAKSIPGMGAAAASKNWTLHDKLFKDGFTISTSILVAGAFAACIARILLGYTYLDERLLPVGEFIILFGVIFGNHVMGCLSSQLRSFRREPLMWVAVTGAIIAVPVGVIAAQRWSSVGVVVTLCLVNLVISLPVAVHIWRRFNERWRE